MPTPRGVGARSPIKPFKFATQAPQSTRLIFPTQYVQSLDAAMTTFSGAVAKQTNKVQAASMSTFSGSLTKQTLKTMLASMSTFSGTLTKQTLKALAASMSTFAGTLAKQTLKALVASMSTFSGSLNKQTLKALVASMSTYAGNLTKQTLKTLVASMSTFAGNSVKKTLKTLAASMSTFAGTLVKKTSKLIAASMSTFSGLLTASHLFLLSLNASMSTFSGNMSRQTGKSLLAGMSTFSGNTAKSTKKFMSASMSAFSGNVNKFTTKFFNAAMSTFAGLISSILTHAQVGPPQPLITVPPNTQVYASFSSQPSIIQRSAGSDLFFSPSIVTRSNNFQAPGQVLLPGYVLVAPSSGRLAGIAHYAFAKGTVTVPPSGAGSTFTVTLNQNYFVSGAIIPDVMAISTPASLAPGTYQWQVVCRMTDNGRGNGILFGNYSVTINGQVSSGAVMSNRDPDNEPIVQLSLGVQFTGALTGADQFQAVMTQFQILR